MKIIRLLPQQMDSAVMSEQMNKQLMRHQKMEHSIWLVSLENAGTKVGIIPPPHKLAKGIKIPSGITMMLVAVA